MLSENAPQSKRETPGHRRLSAILFWIAAGCFAIPGILFAVDAKIALSVTFFSLAVTFFSLGVAFIALGEKQARKARQDSEASSGGSAKQPDAK